MEEIVEEAPPNEESKTTNDEGEKKESDEKTKEDTKTTETTTTEEPKKKKYKKIDLAMDGKFEYGMSVEELKSAIDKEANMAHLDRIVQETSDRRNDLETYIYAMRDSIQSLKEYVTEEEKTVFEKLLEDTSDWLYEDGFDATKSVYINKLQEIRKTGDLAERRKIEANGRQTSINDLQRVIEDQTKVLNSTDEKYSHIEPEERAKAKTAIDETSAWLYDMMGKQGALTSCEEPVLTLALLKEKRNTLDSTVRKIMNKPKPAPPKKEEKKTSETENEKESKENNSEEKAKEEPVVEGDADPDAQNMDVDTPDETNKTDDTKMDTSV